MNNAESSKLWRELGTAHRKNTEVNDEIAKSIRIQRPPQEKADANVRPEQT
jgi:hypothetical protein